MPSTPRLRFAPSPTGMFHVGNARTALFNWFYARRTGGTILLRIEDTDQERNTKEAIEGIFDAIHWLGMDWDGEPTYQSAKQSLHEAAGQRLFEHGAAYYCDCTPDVLQERKKDVKTPGYDGFCRDRGLGSGEGRALRFRIPEGTTVVPDLIRGEVEFDNGTIEDFVVVRASGIPLYVLANLVDDMNDRITHVVRGEEHLPNTPKQILLWRALGGGEPPVYAHLPVIVNEKRQKLSKRRDKVALEMYRDEGYLPEAMRNYLALLGWAPKGDREIVPLQTMIEEFDFADVQKSPAFFDVVKLNAFNGDYIRNLDTKEFIDRSLPFLDKAAGKVWPPESFDADVFVAMAPLVQERVSRLDEVPGMIDFFFLDQLEFDEVARKTLESDPSRAVLDAAIGRYEDCEWSAATLHSVTLELAEANGLKLGKAQAPIRVAITGRKVGPPLFESIEVLGRDRTLTRLRRFREVAGRPFV